jgi:16S rRNA (guanine527-N7)-methyltransferase
MKKQKEDESGVKSLLETNLPYVPRETLVGLLSYAKLVVEWNLHLNLTGANTLHTFIQDHIIDCAIASRYAPHYLSWIDVGSGSGLPGIVWSILRPEEKYYLIEASEKKTAFLHRVVSALHLNNVRVIHTRFEKLSAQDFSELKTLSLNIVSRGTSSPASLLEMARKTKLKWNEWIVFSSEKTHTEFLTLGSKFGMEVKSMSYPKGVHNKHQDQRQGLLTILKIKNDYTIL